MSVVDDLKTQIAAGRITFDDPVRMRKELLGENEGTKVTPLLQSLILELSRLAKIRISELVRKSGISHHVHGRAVDVGNEEIASSLLPQVATDARVRELKIDEIIFDAKVAEQASRHQWNYNEGKKFDGYDNNRLNGHKDHIHFSVKSA